MTKCKESHTQNRQSTQATMDETETNSMRIDAYHATTRLHTVYILAGIMPRLRVNPAKQQSEPKPWSLRTRKRMTREICTIYRLLTGHKAETNRDHFHDDGEYRWARRNILSRNSSVTSLGSMRSVTLRVCCSIMNAASSASMTPPHKRNC